MRKTVKIALADRENISRLFAQGKNVPAVARTLGREPSSIYRELQRTGMTVQTYRAHVAQKIANGRRALPRRLPKLETNDCLRMFVYKHLKKRWSPEQIAHELKQRYSNDMTMRVSHEAIYTHIYILPRGGMKKELVLLLRQKKKKRGRTNRMHEKRGKIPEMTSIHARPAEVRDRSVPGHWESDLIIGKDHKSALGTLVERTTRTVLVIPFRETYDAETVRRAFARCVKRLPKSVFKTLTHDQGKEMSEHRLFTKDTQVQVFFADPASPWQRGTNENTNGLIRDFFPKGTDFRHVSSYQVRRVQDLLNERPRKVLEWKTPKECFEELLVNCN